MIRLWGATAELTGQTRRHQAAATGRAASWTGSSPPAAPYAHTRPMPADAATVAAAAAVLLVISATWGYLSAVRARRADPRLASWAIFTAAMGIGAAGNAVARQWPSCALTAAGSVTCAAIVVSGWRHGSREFGRLDAAGTVLGGAGLALLAAAVARPALVPAAAAVAVSVVTDLAAFAPTFANAWRGNEPWPAYAKVCAASALTLAVTDFAVPAGVIYPAYETAVNAAMVVIVLASPRCPRRNWYAEQAASQDWRKEGSLR